MLTYLLFIIVSLVSASPSPSPCEPAASVAARRVAHSADGKRAVFEVPLSSGQTALKFVDLETRLFSIVSIPPRYDGLPNHVATAAFVLKDRTVVVSFEERLRSDLDPDQSGIAVYRYPETPSRDRLRIEFATACKPLRQYGHSRKLLVASPSGTYLAMLDTIDIGEVGVVDLNGRRSYRALTHTLGEVQALVFSPDSRTLAVAGRFNKIVLWDTRQEKVASHLSFGIKAELDTKSGGSEPVLVHSVEFSRDGKSLAATASDGWTRIWDVESTRLLSEVNSSP